MGVCVCVVEVVVRHLLYWVDNVNLFDIWVTLGISISIGFVPAKKQSYILKVTFFLFVPGVEF